mgnify:CR=1 FL=1
MTISRKNGALTFGLVTIIMIINIVYRIMRGEELGFMEILLPAVFIVYFLSYITWGNKDEKNGIYQDEELGQKIKEKSSKISYYTLVFIIFLVVFADRIINGTFNVLLLIILGVAMIILPTVEFFVARKYK